MPLINAVEPEQAQGRTAEIYNMVKGIAGTVPNAIKLFGASPAFLDLQVGKVGFYFFNHPVLNPQLMHMIRMVVSVEKDCPYCVNINAGMLMKMGVDYSAIEALKKDPQKAPLGEKDKALFLFVIKAIKDAHSIEGKDVEGLRKLGWTDDLILEATALGAQQVAGDILLNTFKVEND